MIDEIILDGFVLCRAQEIGGERVMMIVVGSAVSDDYEYRDLVDPTGEYVCWDPNRALWVKGCKKAAIPHPLISDENKVREIAYTAMGVYVKKAGMAS